MTAPSYGPGLDLIACLEFIMATPNISQHYLQKVIPQVLEKLRIMVPLQEYQEIHERWKNVCKLHQADTALLQESAKAIDALLMLAHQYVDQKLHREVAVCERIHRRIKGQDHASPWRNIDDESSWPETFTPILIFGILPGEDTPAVHEGYRGISSRWFSVRGDETDRQRILATHWRPMPEPPYHPGDPLSEAAHKSQTSQKSQSK